MKSRKVYYAHVMALYDTPQELRDVHLLERLGFEVLNPNAPVHQAGAEREGMNYFKAVVESCGLLAFRALPDGSISSGVALEIEWANLALMPVIELPGSFSRRALTRKQTVEYLTEVGQR